MSQEENVEVQQEQQPQEQPQEQPADTKSTLDILPLKNEEYKTKEYWEKYILKFKLRNSFLRNFRLYSKLVNYLHKPREIILNFL